MSFSSARFLTASATVAACGLIVLTLLFSYSHVSALGAVSNITCQTCVQKAIAAQQPPSICNVVPCQDTTNGITQGQCVLTECRAKSFSGAGQSGTAGLDQVAKILGDLMSKLMQGKPPGGGAPPPSTPPPTNTGSTGCTQTVVVSDIAQLQGNPCATYSPSGSSVGGSSSLLDALGEDSSASVNLSETLLGTITNTNSNTNTNASTGLSSSLGTTSTVPQGSVGLVPGLPGIFGDFKLLTGGATIVVGSRSDAQNTQTSGFYGSGTVGQPQGLVSQWCQGRPWSTNFLSLVIPATFFDGLCASRGYQVGTPVPQQQSPSLQQTTIKANTTPAATTPKPAATTPAATTPAVPPKVDIWAVPAAVPLGARTTIFWNTQGVTNCIETSPDGSFSHNTLSGGAATVPLTGATTFSISCDAPDGSHVTGYVVVNLSI